jgi:sugar lactone lactonase YvrE
MHRWLIALALIGSTAAAEPADDPEHDAVVAYRAKDYPAFLAAMRRFHAREPSLSAAIYNLAAAEALTGAPADAVRHLKRLADAGLGFAVDKDPDFASLGKRADFRAVVAAMARARAPRGKAVVAATLDQRDLLLEGVAYDPKARVVLVSSVRHRKILALTTPPRELTAEGAGGAGGLFGIAVDPARGIVWAASTYLPQMAGYRAEDKDRAGLVAYELATGAPIASYPLPRDGRPHALGDVIVGPGGDAYATDSASPIVYRVTGGATGGKLEVVLEGPFRSLQGLAFAADGKRLYLADYALGVFALDVATRALTRLEVDGVTPGGIDGLYLHRGRLVATQNGIEPHRVIELAVQGDRITQQRVILVDPRIEGLSLGAVVGDDLYLNAAAGWEHYHDDGTPRAGPAPPHVILKVPLRP